MEYKKYGRKTLREKGKERDLGEKYFLREEEGKEDGLRKDGGKRPICLILKSLHP